jgi:hypothetical protein
MNAFLEERIREIPTNTSGCTSASKPPGRRSTHLLIAVRKSIGIARQHAGFFLPVAS